MGIYRVIKAHDGLKVGEAISVPDNRPYLKEVLRLGLWERVDEEAPAREEAPVESEPAAPAKIPSGRRRKK